MQGGKVKIGGSTDDPQLPMDSNLAPEDVHLHEGAEEGWHGHSQAHLLEGQGTKDHTGVPDEASEGCAQDAHNTDLRDETLPGAHAEPSGEGAVEHPRGSPGEGPVGETQPLSTEDAPTQTAALDAHVSVGGAPESLQAFSDGEPTTFHCMNAEVGSSDLTALDVGGTGLTGIEGSRVAEDTMLASPEAAGEDNDPAASTQLSPVYCDTEQAALPLQQDPPPNPVSTMEVVSMAAQLLDKWQDLREVFRIPKKKNNPSAQQEEPVLVATSVSSWAWGYFKYCNDYT